MERLLTLVGLKNDDLSLLFDLSGQYTGEEEAVAWQRQSHRSNTSHSISHFDLNIERVSDQHFLDVQ